MVYILFNDTNKKVKFCQYFGTTRPFLGTKKINEINNNNNTFLNNKKKMNGITTRWFLGSFIILSMHSFPRFHGQRVITGETHITTSSVIKIDQHWIKPLSTKAWQGWCLLKLMFPPNSHITLPLLVRNSNITQQLLNFWSIYEIQHFRIILFISIDISLQSCISSLCNFGSTLKTLFAKTKPIKENSWIMIFQ